MVIDSMLMKVNRENAKVVEMASTTQTMNKMVTRISNFLASLMVYTTSRGIEYEQIPVTPSKDR